MGSSRLKDAPVRSADIKPKSLGIFQTEVANDACQLPQEIRVNILKLGAFINKRTLDILITPAKEKLNILVNINLNIAAGLQGR